ncbi:hypothetical protein [Actinacidiphila glaucinigra]|uniref:MmyB family transcriptional regulator n=1 Tax=Actinacidiphila glaucinigra TaxID=235986 RepID=UPI002DD8A526|nr:hypothetical protein [Actinacidiphila glaucinigra]
MRVVQRGWPDGLEDAAARRRTSPLGPRRDRPSPVCVSPLRVQVEVWRAAGSPEGHSQSPVARAGHPDVGPLTLSFQALDVREAPGQQLVVYQAQPDSPSAQALHLLGNLQATRRQSEPSPYGP